MTKEEAVVVLEDKVNELMNIKNIGSLQHHNIIVLFDAMLKALKVLKAPKQD